ncbi:cytochrome P450 4p1-like isoform X1 [Stomoxys calcitrans]|nr:cytochrome P450 4p1-like isoform X1 [Stomoxys calcitrans]
MDAEQKFEYFRQNASAFKRNYVQYYLRTPVLNIIDANDAELVLNDPRLLSKGLGYKFLHPFIQTGLLTSDGEKWRSRRRLLLPTFNYNILQQFVDIFKQESLNFVETLNTHFKSEDNNAVILLNKLMPILTLNNICETAMGVHLDDRLDCNEYRQHFAKIEKIFFERTTNPIMIFDFIYFKTRAGKNYLKTMETLHAFSSGIIEKRRKLLSDLEKSSENSSIPNDEDMHYSKQRYVLLDSLLRAEKEGLIDHAGICEEVDTFVIAGSDTTAIGLIFAFMNLSLHPEVQQKCYEEMQEHISDDLSNLDMANLAKLQYFNCVLKESQRLYPTAPYISRECSEDTVFKGNILLPKGTQINIHIYDIHRSAKYYEEPEVFKPERFLPEQRKNHPASAFFPFSAGLRSCIGEKFAMLEMKTLMVLVLKNFILEPITYPDEIRCSIGVALRCSHDIKIKLRRRY